MNTEIQKKKQQKTEKELTAEELIKSISGEDTNPKLKFNGINFLHKN